MTDAGKNDTTEAPNPFLPSPDDLQHWASVMGRAQQMMLEYALGQANDGNNAAASLFDPASWLENPTTATWAEQSSQLWEQGTRFWTSLATLQPPFAPAADAPMGPIGAAQRQGRALDCGAAPACTPRARPDTLTG